MAFMPQVIAGLFGLAWAFLLGASFTGKIGFCLIAVTGGVFASSQAGGREWVYWVCLVLIIAMFVMTLFGVNISGFFFASPIAFALGTFTARMTMRFVR